MAHIHTEPGQHDHTASAYIVRFDTEEPQLMLHMHKKIGRLMQAGGHVELDENPWQAISHEIVEETGYDLTQLKILQPSYSIKSLPNSVVHPVAVCQNTHDYGLGLDHKHVDTVYAFVTNELPHNVPGEGESQDIRWVTLAELNALTPQEVVSNARAIGTAILTVLIHEWEPVPLTNFQL